MLCAGTIPTVFVLCLLGACSSGSDTMEIVQFEQEGRTDIKLNEPLVFRFSSPVDPTSVGAASVVIMDDEGSSALGAWRTTGSEVRFHPAHPPDASYDGAGFSFGTRYRVVFAGYPMHGTILSTSGRSLARRTVYYFSTIDMKAALNLYDGFVDHTPSEAPRLLAVNGVPVGEVPYQGLEIAPDAALMLEFSEPLHPATVLDVELPLHALDLEGVPAGGSAVVPMLCSFAAGSDNRVVLARSRNPLVAGRRYNLNSESIGFRDFGGHGVRGDDFNFIQFRCRD